MHVCIDYRPALREGTGVGTYVHGLLAGLGRCHPEADYSAFSASWRDRLALPHDLAGVRAVDAKVPVRLLDRLWHRGHWPPIEHWTGPLDIAHSPSPLLIPARLARTVITIHDCYFLREPEAVSGVVRRDYVPLMRQATRDADAIVAVSETTRVELQELLGIPAERVHVTYNGGSEGFSHVAGARDQVASWLGIDRPYVLFVGRRELRKDMPTLLRGFAEVGERFTDLQLVLVGPGGDGWAETWSAVPPAVAGRVHIVEHQPAERLATLYSGAQMLALPSLWEGFGLTAIEAMACDTPVIAARAGALPEILGDAAEWFEVGSAEALANGIARLLEDTARREELIVHGRDQAARYTWDHTARLTYELYKKLGA